MYETCSKKGLAVYMACRVLAKGKIQEGSDWIIKVLEKQDDRPLWVSVWVDKSLAQALWKIKNTKSAADADKLYKKLRVYTISDQDDSGPWIRENFSSIFYM